MESILFGSSRKGNAFIFGTLLAAMFGAVAAFGFFLQDNKKKCEVRTEAITIADKNYNGVLEEGEIVDFAKSLGYLDDGIVYSAGQLEEMVYNASPDMYQRHIEEHK